MATQRVDRISRVAYIDTDQTEQNVRHLLSQYGTIREIYSFLAKGKFTHFFVEFDDATTTERATACKSSTIKVYALADRPQWISRFASLCSPALSLHSVKPELQDNSIPALATEPRPRKRRVNRPERGEAIVKNPRTTLRRSSYDKKKHEYNPYPPSHPAHFRSPRKNNTSAGYMHDFEKENGQMQDALPVATSSTSVSDSVASTQPDIVENAPRLDYGVRKMRGIPFNAITSLLDPSFPCSIPQPSPTPFALPSHSFSSVTSIGPLPTPAPSTPTPAFSPSIVLSHDGTDFVYDLDALSEDPQSMVDILKQTAASASRRDKWMIVAGHYRGKGNVKAALVVVTAMIEVMTSPSVGIPEQELRPAFLMLSSCHTDLAKRARRLEHGEAEREKHLRKAQECLQKVYGTNTPLSGEQTLAAPQPSRNYLLNNFRVTDPFAVVQDDRTPAKPNNDKAIGEMHRELQSLRDRHQNLNRQLTQTNDAKRSLEEDLEKQQHLRRKDERELSRLQQEVSSANRSERFALDQCRREVEIRRKAEQRAGELKDELAKARQRLEATEKGVVEKERRVKEYFGRLATMFLKASKGEIGVLEDAVLGLTRERDQGSSNSDAFKREQHSMGI